MQERHIPCSQSPCCAVITDELLELVRGEACGCRDVAVLAQAAVVLCHLAGAPAQATAELAMQALLALLVNRYPKVRRAVAEQLYIRLMTLEEHARWAGCALDAAADVLCESLWDGPRAGAKAARDGLYPLLRLQAPVKGAL